MKIYLPRQNVPPDYYQNSVIYYIDQNNGGRNGYVPHRKIFVRYLLSGLPLLRTWLFRAGNADKSGRLLLHAARYLLLHTWTVPVLRRNVPAVPGSIPASILWQNGQGCKILLPRHPVAEFIFLTNKNFSN